MNLTWQGVDRRGIGRGGCVTDTAASLAESLYDTGFRRARVVRDGVIVGAVEAASQGRKRTWWGESR